MLDVLWIMLEVIPILFCKKIDSDTVYSKIEDLLVGSGIIHSDDFDDAMRKRELMEMGSESCKSGKSSSRKK